MKKSWLWLAAAVVAMALLYGSSLGIGAGQALWVLLLLLCPLMHFFGMRNLGGHGHGPEVAPDDRPAASPPRTPDRDRG